MSYDIIGDIHGQYGKLETLLRKLGYHESGGAWRHPGRQAVFVGDFVDRGPEQVRTVETVRRTVDSGAALAVMGNHELNAIAWHTADPRNPGEFLRPHDHPAWGPKNRAQHEEFLAEVEHRPALHAELIDWFLMLPLWLDLPGIRVVHACWHQPFMDWLAPRLHGGRWLTRDLMADASTEPEDPAEKDTADPSIFKAVERLTKGIEVPLPDGHSFVDKDGHLRTRVRVKWWDGTATTYRAAAMLGVKEREALPETDVPAHARVNLAGPPVIFGHYWLTGSPSLESGRCTCIDYSAGVGGALVAYRFEGEPELQSDRLVWVE